MASESDDSKNDGSQHMSVNIGGDVNAPINIAGRDIVGRSGRSVQTSLEWGLYIDGTSYGDSQELVSGVPKSVTLHLPKRRDKLVQFLFSLTNTGNFPAQAVEAEIKFRWRHLWEQVFDIQETKRHLMQSNRWDSYQIGPGQVAVWKYELGPTPLLPDRDIRLGPFMKIMSPEMGTHDASVECMAVSDNGIRTFYTVQINVVPPHPYQNI